MGSLDHICGTTIPIVDPKQSPGRRHNRKQRIARKAHPNLSEVFFRENKLQQKSLHNSWRQVRYVKLRGGRLFNRRRKSNHFNMN